MEECVGKLATFREAATEQEQKKVVGISGSSIKALSKQDSTEEVSAIP